MDKQSPAEHRSRGRCRFGAPRLLIVGCGDVGLRIVARLCTRYRVVALTSSPARRARLRAAGTVPIVGDLDERAALARIAAFGARVIHLAPPPAGGTRDPRTRHLVSTLRDVQRFVYISTTGVYGDRAGEWIDESTPVAPRNERALRRVDAERVARAANACVLRVPGIYAHDRLPLERLRAGTPTLAPEDDVHTNHIHADDLARIAIAALHRGRSARVYNAVDESQLKMGEYFDLVAERFALPRPPRLPREQLRRAVSPMTYSFMSESRRLRNERLRRELKLKLRWPTVAAALADPHIA